jgi:7-carboxy-7-deazaguanine synthase
MLKITEIFYSLQGETTFAGLPTVFIRLTGCPLRCGYCDTAYAFSGGTNLSIDAIVNQVQTFNTQFITVTGGEPLAQKDCHELLTQLCDRHYTVSLETSGALDVSLVDPRVHKILDIKTPGSNESHRNLLSNLTHITSEDQIKFVICNQADYLWSKAFLSTHDLLNRCTILFSPSYADVPAVDLAEWILQDQLPVRFQLQMHKHIWGDAKGK